MDFQDKSHGGKIFGLPGPNCPVECVEKYLSKLNDKNMSLWQRPKKGYVESSQCWYDNSTVGVNKLRGFMKMICDVANLSRQYTNHTPRATSITILGRSFPDTDVAMHSGHKSLGAMSIYKKTSEKTKMSMSHALSSTLLTHQTIAEEQCTSLSRDAHDQCCISYGAETQLMVTATSSIVTPSNEAQNVDIPLTAIASDVTPSVNTHDDALLQMTEATSSSFATSGEAMLNQPTAFNSDNLADIDIDQLLVQECEKVERQIHIQSLFSNCIFHGNVSINFPNK
jgi:hypothetical protein